MPSAYPIRRLDHLKPHRIRLHEQMGSKEKFWLQHPKTNRRALWKMARPGTGEDWSEKVAYELAKLLHIPCARVDLATMGDANGVVCWDLLYRRDGSHRPALIHGNELLREADPEYPHAQYYRLSKHTVQAVHDALQQADPPGGTEYMSHIRDAFDAFVGYLLLDALIGNTDRHHENWGVVATRVARGRHRRQLAPTYDHASSMGRELDDTKRLGRLGKQGRGTVADYADKARSAFANPLGDRQIHPRDAFAQAARLRPLAASAWLQRLRGTTLVHIHELVERVPPSRLSPVGKRFTKEILSHNYDVLLRLPL